jgi:hypothetical protein
MCSGRENPNVKTTNHNVKTTNHNATKMDSSFTVSNYSIHWKMYGKVDVTNSGRIKFRQIKSKVLLVHAMKAYDGMEVQLHLLFSSAVHRSQR